MKDEIRQQLEQAAQVIAERMPDMAKRAEAVELTAVQLKDFMAKHRFTQAGVAKKIGVSSSMVNQFLQGKYKGDVKILINRIINLINSIEGKESLTKHIPYVETSVARKIRALIINTEKFSDTEGKIALILGDGGHGKSHCLRQYAEANKNSLYVELDDAMTTTLIFAEIADKLKLDASGRLGAVTRCLIEHLQNRNIIIMLDEASSLTVRQLNLLRQVIAVKCRCPLILAGNLDLFKTIMQKTTRHGYESLDQFTSRLMGILNLDEMASHKDNGLYSAEDIRKLYQYSGVRLTSDAVGALRRIGRTPRTGRLRTCSQVIDALHITKEVNQNPIINTDLIVKAIMDLGLPVRCWIPINTLEAGEAANEEPTAIAAG